jgi:8-amino-7-oxononanoate synthase
MSWTPWVALQLDLLAQRNLIRERRIVTPLSGTEVLDREARLVTFSSNDYLGLASHPDVRAAIASAAAEYGNGPRASPLVLGHTIYHQRLEDRLATLAGKDRAVLFPTGFATNLGVLPALADEDTAIFSDALNHASIVDACRLAKRQGAEVVIYPHLDIEALERGLRTHRKARALIITESVFSMDGDLAPLVELTRLKSTHDALLLVDESHGTGVFGKCGGGLTEHLGVQREVDLFIGTLSKALGGLGGFVAGAAPLIALILNRARTGIFSTALPVPVVAGVLAAIDTAAREPERQIKLHGGMQRLEVALNQPIQSPIVPIVLGDESRALEAAEQARQSGLHLVAIRPPTVPQHTSRLRVTLSADHTPTQIDQLVAFLKKVRDGNSAKMRR